MTPFALSITLGAAAGAVNVAGGLLLVRGRPSPALLEQLIALGAGFLLATAVLEMIPHALAGGAPRSALLILFGYVLVYLLERTVIPHAHLASDMPETHALSRKTTRSVLFGLAVHTFFDGVAIGSGFVLSRWLGWIIFLAILLHKLPEGLTAASFLLSAGRERKTAIAATLLLAGMTLAGTFLIGLAPRLVNFGLPAAAGVTAYVAASGLVPEVNRHPGPRSTLAFLLGIGLFLGVRSIADL